VNPPTPPKPRAFAALASPGFRPYLVTFFLTMMADNIEHVISYWLLFQKFHSAALGGFAVVAHWLPFLVFSLPVGALNDRFDSRRLIQIGGALFCFVSLSWGYLFLTDTLEMWHAMVLLVLHGCAGVFWSASSQMLLYDIVGPEALKSAVRLNATARYLGVLVGPGIGSVVMLTLGPTRGIFLNACFYLPLLIWLVRAPYGRHFRTSHATPTESDASAPAAFDTSSPLAATTGHSVSSAPEPPNQRAVRGFGDLVQSFRDIRRLPVIGSMVALAGAASFFVGNSYQAQMPGFASDLGHGDPGVAYTSLLAADAAGALLGGLLLEVRSDLFSTTSATALKLAAAWGVALFGFALIQTYPLALALLFLAGFFELSFSSLAQTLVQLHAPDAARGRVLGLYAMAASGLRTFSGLTVGLAGSFTSIHTSLAASASLFVAVCLSLRGFAKRH
jgi:MFS family permease